MSAGCLCEVPACTTKTLTSILYLPIPFHCITLHCITFHSTAAYYNLYWHDDKHPAQQCRLLPKSCAPWHIPGQHTAYKRQPVGKKIPFNAGKHFFIHVGMLRANAQVLLHSLAHRSSQQNWKSTVGSWVSC